MNVETIKITDLDNDPANARKHNAKNLSALKGSLKRFGQQKPIVVSKDNVVIAGNATLEAARALEWKHIQIVRTELTGADLTAYGIADNRTSELAEWDDDILSQTLDSLRTDGIDLEALGWNTKELEKILNEPSPPSGIVDEPAKEYLIVIECPDEMSQKEVYEELQERGLKCKIM